MLVVLTSVFKGPLGLSVYVLWDTCLPMIPRPVKTQMNVIFLASVASTVTIQEVLSGAGVIKNTC